MIFSNNPSFKKAEQGFTLIELMISLVLGLILIAGLVTAFMGTSRSSKLNAETPALIRANSAPTENYFEDSFRAHVVTSGATWSPAPHSTFNIPTTIGAPIPGTHAFSVQFGSTSTYLISPMAATSSAITVQGNNVDIVTGDLALISDCNGADIFEVTADNANVLQHGASANGGDNRLSAPYGQGSALNRPRIMRFEANIYYIGDTGRTDANDDPVRALFRQTLPYVNPPIELAEGIENMRVRLGVEDPTAEGSISFVSPDNPLLATHQVQSVQVGFLMQSYDNVSESNDTRSYQIAGFDIPSSTGTVSDGSAHSEDQKLRMTFNGTVSLRNR